MFANSYQSGFISIFYSVGSNPLALWDKQVKYGHIRRIVDDEVRSLVLDISGANVATTYITCPIKPRASLDDKEMHRRFRVSNFQSSTKVKPFCTTMPIGLSSGWNQVQFNLADFTKRAYGSTYCETMRVQIHANVRVRRLYFTDTLYTDEELPNELKLFGPLSKKKELEKKASKVCEEKPPEEVPPPPSPVDTTVVEEMEPKEVAALRQSQASGEDAKADQVETEVATIEGDAVVVSVVEGASSEFEEEGETEEEGEIEEGVELVSGGAPEVEEAAIAEGAEAAEGAEGAPQSGETPEAPKDEVPAEETPIEALAQSAEPPAETTEPPAEAAEPPVEATEPPAEPEAAEGAAAEAPPAE